MKRRGRMTGRVAFVLSTMALTTLASAGYEYRISSRQDPQEAEASVEKRVRAYLEKSGQTGSKDLQAKLRREFMAQAAPDLGTWHDLGRLAVAAGKWGKEIKETGVLPDGSTDTSITRESGPLIVFFREKSYTATFRLMSEIGACQTYLLTGYLHPSARRVDQKGKSETYEYLPPDSSSRTPTGERFVLSWKDRPGGVLESAEVYRADYQSRTRGVQPFAWTLTSKWRIRKPGKLGEAPLAEGERTDLQGEMAAPVVTRFVRSGTYPDPATPYDPVSFIRPGDTVRDEVYGPPSQSYTWQGTRRNMYGSEGNRRKENESASRKPDPPFLYLLFATTCAVLLGVAYWRRQKTPSPNDRK